VADLAGVIALFGGMWLASIAADSPDHFELDIVAIAAVGIVAAIAVQITIGGTDRWRP
jgi:hypothetical protein